jgi:hypothetical protein
MTEIKKYLKDKKTSHERFKFKINTGQGSEIYSYSSLEDFSNKWLNCEFGELEELKMLSKDGDVIYPADKATREGIKEYLSVKENLKKFKFSGEENILLRNATGLEYEGVSKLIYKTLQSDNSTNKYIETSQGRVFLLKNKEDLYDKFVHYDSYLRKVDMPKGSMSLEDVIVIKDKLNGFNLVIDQRNEAVELIDMVSRSLTKNKILKANHQVEEYDSEVGDFMTKVFTDIYFYANDESLNKIQDKIKHLGKNFDYKDERENKNIIYFYNYGFKNSKEIPASKDKLIHAVCLLMSPSDLKNMESDNIGLIAINKDILSALGSKTSEAYINIDNKEITIKEGDFIKINSKNEVNILTKEEIENKDLKQKSKHMKNIKI